MDTKLIRMPGIVFPVQSFSHACMYKANEEQYIVVVYIEKGSQEVFKGTSEECEQYLDKIHQEMSGWILQE